MKHKEKFLFVNCYKNRCNIGRMNERIVVSSMLHNVEMNLVLIVLVVAL